MRPEETKSYRIEETINFEFWYFFIQQFKNWIDSRISFHLAETESDLLVGRGNDDELALSKGVKTDFQLSLEAWFENDISISTLRFLSNSRKVLSPASTKLSDDTSSDFPFFMPPNSR